MKIGYFGKLPSYGDFIQRNVSPSLVKYLDQWILQSIESSRGQLRDNWKQHYFNSPIWRFVISKNIISESDLTGLIMPSVDKAGRCYPFMVICESENEQALNPFILARNSDKLHENCEDFTLGLLEKANPDLDEIATVIGDIYSPIKEAECLGAELNSILASQELGCIMDDNLTDFSGCNDTFLQLSLNLQNVKSSIWWTLGGVDFKPRKRYFVGLPPVDTYTSFLQDVPITPC